MTDLQKAIAEIVAVAGEVPRRQHRSPNDPLILEIRKRMEVVGEIGPPGSSITLGRIYGIELVINPLIPPELWAVERADGSLEWHQHETLGLVES